MTRSTAREIAMHCSFSLSFTLQTADELLEERLIPEIFDAWKDEDPIYEKYPDAPQLDYIRELVRGVGEHAPELDEYISRHAKNWKFARIPRTAAAIMRVAMYEILYMPAIPNRAAINEAVEIAKKYEDEKVVAFLNGILGSFVREECLEEAGL
ncbi:MAG: nusB [Firmicutes bacterium]|nr:nusB [Bacillota bacterium]